MEQVLKLETLRRKAPLGLRFIDLGRNALVTDGFEVTARPFDPASPASGPDNWQLAVRSPVSGIYGFTSLPGLGAYERGERPASDWCGTVSPASPPNPEDELSELEIARRLLEIEGATSQPNFVIRVEDRQRRFLPQTLLMCLPKTSLVEVPLFSGPARSALPGLGLINGELRIFGSDPPLPAGWALVTASPDPDTSYVTVADERGMFSLFMPYASALPALVGSPPHSSAELAWVLNIEVYFQPSRQRRISGLDRPSDPPDTRSILQQGLAGLYDQAEAGRAGPNLLRTIRFGQNLRIATQDLPYLLLDPA
jgi:hypothetical protein